jgi:hypothetical protein
MATVQVISSTSSLRIAFKHLEGHSVVLPAIRAGRGFMHLNPENPDPSPNSSPSLVSLPPEAFDQHMSALFEQFQTDLPGMLEKAKLKAEKASSALITPAWQRLIGPAWKMVAAMQTQVLTSNYVYQPGEHAFGTLKCVAELTGVSERTVQRWTSKNYAGSRWLKAWMSWRPQYITREDGLPCKSGTVFRLNLEPKPTHDITPALKALWRTFEDLPANRLRQLEDIASEDLSNAFLNTRQESASVRTFPKGQKCFQSQIQVEGRDINIAQNTLISNTRQTLEARNAELMARLSTSSIHHTEALAKAETAAARLNDKHSVIYWYKHFRHAISSGSGESTIWAAISNALEARDSGLVRGKTAAYAVGVLNRTLGRTSSNEGGLFPTPAQA